MSTYVKPSASELPSWNLQLVENLDDLRPCYEWVCDQANAGRSLAIDTETKGLQWWNEDYVRLVQFGREGTSYAIPIEMWKGLAHACLEVVRDSHIPVHGWNWNFDAEILYFNGLPTPHMHNVHDGMLAHTLLHPQEAHGLKSVSANMLGSWAKHGQAWLRGEARRLGFHGETYWAKMPFTNTAYWGYACIDTLLNWHVNQIIVPQVLDDYEEAYTREMEYLGIVIDMQRRGLQVDLDYCKQLTAMWENELYSLAYQLDHEHGIKNPASNKQIEQAFIIAGWEPEVFTTTGQASLDKKVMAQLKQDARFANAAELIIRHRRVSKWLSTYISKFAESNGTVYPTVRTMRAKTGRSSITEPPLQTLPGKASGSNEIRRAILPRREDELLVSCDYMGQEPRLMASYAEEPTMMQFFMEGDGDLHSFVARSIFGENFTPHQRGAAKAVDLALGYGAGAGKMAETAGMPESVIQEFLGMYYDKFPQIPEWISTVIDLGKRRLREEGSAYAYTGGGRLVVADPGKVYTLVNYIIQGTGSDVFKSAAVRLKEAGLIEYFVLPVHDEALFSFPRDDAAELAKMCSELMADYTYLVPLITDISEPMETWGGPRTPLDV